MPKSTIGHLRYNSILISPFSNILTEGYCVLIASSLHIWFALVIITFSISRKKDPSNLLTLCSMLEVDTISFIEIGEVFVC